MTDKKLQVFNVYDCHYEIEEIRKFAVPWMFKEECLAEQFRIQSLVKSVLPDLRARLAWNPAEIYNWRLNQLRLLADWCYQTVPFYHESFRSVGYEPGAIRNLEDYASLPVLSRQDIIDNFPDNILSANYSKANCRWLTSSGSSGQPLQLIMQQDRTEWDTLFRMRMFEQMSGEHLPSDRWIYNVNHALWWHTSFNGDYPVFTVSQKCPLQSILKHILYLRPSMMSVISSFAEKMVSSGVNLKEYGVKLVSTNSETSTFSQRRQWSDVLGVPVCDEYSSEEVGLLAHECRYGQYHTVEDDTYLEIDNPDQDGVGSVIGTDLWNFAMPIIRYDQGDFASFSTDPNICHCGSHFRKVNAILGRVDEAFLSRKGRVLPGQLLEASENFLSHDESGMIEYRVIQRTFDEVEIIYVPHPRFPSLNQSLINQFNLTLESLFRHQVHLTCKRVSKIENINRYKRRVFICAMEKS